MDDKFANDGSAEYLTVAKRLAANSFIGGTAVVGGVLCASAASLIGIVLAVPVGACYVASPGFSRMCDFWWYMMPLIMEYRGIKAKAWLEGCSTDELDERFADFHRRTAPKVFDAIVTMKGVFVKMGQLFSTIGMGIFEDAYVQALKPLQDGLPPRSQEEISGIIEAEVGLPMSQLFQHFEPEPVGAASIGQAHRAVLADGRRVIVKVQYPDIAEQYTADFDCLETLTQWTNPDMMPMLEKLRKRHESELDFRNEARHLRNVRFNMMFHGFEPKLVRIPEVIENKLCTRCVLAMEELEGFSMKSALTTEADKLALALGYANGEDFRLQMRKRLIENSKQGKITASIVPKLDTKAMARAAEALRFWVQVRERYFKFHNVAASVLHRMTGQTCCQPYANLDEPASHADLGKVLKDLVYVHGYQLLMDGIVNLDPHPGNVLLLSDGRIGLIDYGMVGQLELADRLLVARVVVALADGNEEEAVRIYEEAGYRFSFPQGEPPKPKNVLKRLISFHFDRFDLSPIEVGEANPWHVMELTDKMSEECVPDWIETSTRLTGLLLGIGNQAARPFSIAEEWAPIARLLLKSPGGTKLDPPRSSNIPGLMLSDQISDQGQGASIISLMLGIA